MTIKQVAVTAAKEAGLKALKLAKGGPKFTMKSSHDIQAEADLAAEKIITAAIRRHFPDHAILAEESGRNAKKSEYLWVIDPIDGTINYSRGLDTWGVCIALEHKGKLIFGLIYQPALDRMYVAERGKGAFLNGKRMRVSNETKLINCLMSTDNTHKIPRRKRAFKLLAKICHRVRHVRIMGSTALHAALIAEGKVDFHYKPEMNYWDFASGILLVEEAGGKVTDWEGWPITVNSKRIVISNGRVHKDALRLINQAK